MKYLTLNVQIVFPRQQQKLVYIYVKHNNCTPKNHQTIQNVDVLNLVDVITNGHKYEQYLN